MRRSLTVYEWVWMIIAVLAIPLVALMIWDRPPTMSGAGNAAAALWRDLGPLGALVVVGIAALVLFTPSLVAYQRGHPNVMAIFAFNLLLGLTGIGWAIALVWALTAVDKPRT
jgi:Superinfection immunity protein